MTEIIILLKTDRVFLYLVFLIVIVLPSLVIIHYLKENRLVDFPKIDSGILGRPAPLSVLLSFLIMLPFIMTYKFSFLVSAGLIVAFAIMFLPFVTFYTSKGKEITFDSNNRPVPKYGKLNAKRQTLASLFMFLFFAALVSLYFVDKNISDTLVIYYYVVPAGSMLLWIYFREIVECEYCSCLNFKGMSKVCKHCSIPLESNSD